MELSAREIANRLSKRISTNIGVIVLGIGLLCILSYLTYQRGSIIYKTVRDYNASTGMSLSVDQLSKQLPFSREVNDNETYENVEQDKMNEKEYTNFTKKLAEVKQLYKDYNEKVVKMGKDLNKDGSTEIIDERLFSKEHDEY